MTTLLPLDESTISKRVDSRDPPSYVAVWHEELTDYGLFPVELDVNLCEEPQSLFSMELLSDRGSESIPEMTNEITNLVELAKYAIVQTGTF
jgi:hypothetical protein